MSTRRNAKKAPEGSSRQGQVVTLRGASLEPAPALGPGAHFARLLRKLGEGRYEADVTGGGRVAVGVAPGVDLALTDRSFAEQEVVLVGMLGEEAVVFGALRTREARPEVVVVEAPRKLVLRAGRAKVELTEDGKVRISGNDLTVDAPRTVRLASKRVEIP